MLAHLDDVGRVVQATLWLHPLSMPHCGMGSAGEPSGEDRRGGHVNGSPATVLIVDDNEDVRDFLRLLFHIEGFLVIGEACDGIEAAIIASELAPDLVVMDHLMPRRSGDKTAAVIRATVPTAQILAYSAVLENKPEWADGFVPKGRIAQLLPAARKVLAVSS